MIVIIVIFFNNFFIFYFLHFKKIYLDYKKQLMKDIEIFLKKKEKKWVVNITKISQKISTVTGCNIFLFFELGNYFLKYKRNIRLERFIS